MSLCALAKDTTELMQSERIRKEINIISLILLRFNTVFLKKFTSLLYFVNFFINIQKILAYLFAKSKYLVYNNYLI